MLKIPDRQKPDQHYLEQENSRIVRQILHAKSELRFATLPMAQPQTTRNASRMKTGLTDFSDIYEASKMHTQKINKIHIKLHKGKDKVKAHIKFVDYLQLVGQIREDALTLLLFVSANSSKTSSIMTFKDLATSDIVIDAPRQSVEVYVIEKVANREMRRFKFAIS